MKRVVRFDRWVTVHLANPIVTLRGNDRSSRMPILMYHSVSCPDRFTDNEYFETSTSPDRFEMQMRLLSEGGYRGMNLSGLEGLRGGEYPSGNPRCFMLTFDDGFQDFKEEAFPILKEFGFSATVFLPTDYIGKTNRKFKGKECLTWGETKELHKSGIEFGSHTLTHRELRSLDRNEIRKEISESKMVIEDALGDAVRYFSYPYAFPEADVEHTKYVKETLVECGYRHCVTTAIGIPDAKSPGFYLKRLPVNHHDDEPFFLAKLSGGYDWLHGIQYLKKVLF